MLTDNGYRIIEIWDDKAGLELFERHAVSRCAGAENTA